MPHNSTPPDNGNIAEELWVLTMAWLALRAFDWRRETFILKDHPFEFGISSFLSRLHSTLFLSRRKCVMRRWWKVWHRLLGGVACGPGARARAHRCGILLLLDLYRWRCTTIKLWSFFKTHTENSRRIVGRDKSNNRSDGEKRGTKSTINLSIDRNRPKE